MFRVDFEVLFLLHIVLPLRVIWFLVRVSHRQPFHITGPTEHAGDQSTRRFGQFIWDRSFQNLRIEKNNKNKKLASVDLAITWSGYLVVKYVLAKVGWLTLSFNAVSDSHLVSGSYSFTSSSNFSLFWLMLRPSLAMFWNFLPSNSGNDESAYSSTASTKYNIS